MHLLQTRESAMAIRMFPKVGLPPFFGFPLRLQDATGYPPFSLIIHHFLCLIPGFPIDNDSMFVLMRPHLGAGASKSVAWLRLTRRNKAQSSRLHV